MQWENQFHTIQSTLCGAQDSITIVSPYITLDALKSLLDGVGVTDIRILTSWRKDDFISGLAKTDLAIVCMENGWDLHLFHDGHPKKLHSKMYIADAWEVWLGSANLTHTGLGLAQDSNVEIMTCQEYTEALGEHVEGLFASAARVDGNLLAHFVRLENIIPPPVPLELEWEPPEVPGIPTVSDESLDEIGGKEIFDALWDIMPSKPLASEFNADIPLDEQLYLRGCRWGEFRQVLRSINVDRDLIDHTIDALYTWALTEHPSELDVQVGGRGRHTHCLVWRMDSLR